MLVAGDAFGQGRGGPPAQAQGFESTSQNPATYSAPERAAVGVIERWVDTTNTKDLAAHMAVVDNEVVYRSDPARTLGHGARGYCASYNFTWDYTWVRLDELYVVGGPSETLALLKRTDFNQPAPGAAGGGGLGGYPVEVAVLARVKGGKVVEWLDAPVDRIGVAAAPNTRPIQLDVPAPCAPYAASPLQRTAMAGEVINPQRVPEGRVPPNPGLPRLPSGMASYGTTKRESVLNTEETAAVQTVRAWFASWKAGDPILLAAFVDKDVVFRPAPAAINMVNGRDALLKTACSTIGGPLELTELYVIGGALQTLVIARWNRTDASGASIPMGSFFRVQRNLITEWMDVPLGATALNANANSAACQTVNTRLAAFAPLPVISPPAGALAGPQPR